MSVLRVRSVMSVVRVTSVVSAITVGNVSVLSVLLRGYECYEHEQC